MAIVINLDVVMAQNGLNGVIPKGGNNSGKFIYS